MAGVQLRRLNQLDVFMSIPKSIPLRDIEIRKPTYLIPKFIEEGQPNLLFGSGGCGKSYLAIQMALSMAGGFDFIGELPTRKVKTTYLDFENCSNTFAYRCQTLATSNPLWSDDIKDSIFYLTTGGRALHAVAKEVKEEIVKTGSELLIIDSAAYACGGDASDQEQTIAFFSAVNQLEITTLIIAHETKAKNRDTAFGSVFFMNSARNVWNVSKEHEVGSGTVNLTLSHKKGNNSALSDDVCAVMSFEGEDTVSITKSKHPNISVSQTTVLKAVCFGGSTYKEIAESTGLDEKAVKSRLSELKSKGLVVNQFGKWNKVNEL